MSSVSRLAFLSMLRAGYKFFALLSLLWGLWLSQGPEVEKPGIGSDHGKGKAEQGSSNPEFLYIAWRSTRQGAGNESVKPIIYVIHYHRKDNVEDDQDYSFARLLPGLCRCGLKEEKHDKLSKNYTDRDFKRIYKNIHPHGINKNPLY